MPMCSQGHCPEPCSAYDGKQDHYHQHAGDKKRNADICICLTCGWVLCPLKHVRPQPMVNDVARRNSEQGQRSDEQPNGPFRSDNLIGLLFHVAFGW